LLVLFDLGKVDIVGHHDALWRAVKNKANGSQARGVESWKILSNTGPASISYSKILSGGGRYPWYRSGDSMAPQEEVRHLMTVCGHTLLSGAILWYRENDLTRSKTRDKMSAWSQKITFHDPSKPMSLTKI
jgi:hypothetical protein